MFDEISIKSVKKNLVKAIADEWMLITAGDKDGYNMMTASWGFLGEMWGEDTAMVVVRPQRYTMEFINKNDYFTISFYGENKDIHKICGTKSGRDVDKTALTGLTPVFLHNSVFFREANLVLVCKKQYVGDMTEDNFIDKEPLKWYENKDYHKMIFGKIEKVLVKV
ncbi:MAG: flavin reductase family protein [Ruminococcaceae bacterium]|nr:flavin reductase family protein [Oscillospiraceae bacterium]